MTSSQHISLRSLRGWKKATKCTKIRHFTKTNMIPTAEP